MPFLPATEPPGKRRAPVWPLILAGVVLLPLGLFAWGWYQPVVVTVGNHGAGFGWGWGALNASVVQADAAYKRDPKSTLRYEFHGQPMPEFVGGHSYMVWWY